MVNQYTIFIIDEYNYSCKYINLLQWVQFRYIFEGIGGKVHWWGLNQLRWRTWVFHYSDKTNKTNKRKKIYIKKINRDFINI